MASKTIQTGGIGEGSSLLKLIKSTRSVSNVCPSTSQKIMGL